MRVTYCILVRPAQETSMHYFLCSGGTGKGSKKYVPGYVMPNLCFCIWWDLRVTYCILVCPECETSTHFFHARVGLVRFP
jgi:hypothetical protein